MPQQTINLIIVSVAGIIAIVIVARTIGQMMRRRTIRNINRGVTLRVDPHKEIMAEITECSGPNYDFRKITPKKGNREDEQQQELPAEGRRRGYRTVPGMNPRDAVGRGE